MKQRILAAAITALLVNVLVYVAINATSWFMRDRLPIGTIIDKRILPEYYEPFTRGPQRYWLAITSPDGNRCTSIVVDEDVWAAYEVGDVVTEWGVRK